MVKSLSVITVIGMVLSVFLLFGCDQGAKEVVDKIKELEVDLTDVDVDVDVLVEVVDTVTAEVIVAVPGIPGEVNVVSFVDPGNDTVEVNVKVFETTSTDVVVTKESTTVDVNVNSLCTVVVDLDTMYKDGTTLDVSVDCGDAFPVDVDVDVPGCSS